MVEGLIEGLVEGLLEGLVEDLLEGLVEGLLEGLVEGTKAFEGMVEGTGRVEGTIVCTGRVEGTIVLEGRAEGLKVDLVDGVAVGTVVGLAVGMDFEVGPLVGRFVAVGGSCKDGEVVGYEVVGIRVGLTDFVGTEGFVGVVVGLKAETFLAYNDLNNEKSRLPNPVIGSQPVKH